MYAVIATGGKQYRVKVGDTVKVETLDVEVGKTHNFDSVHMVGQGSDIKQGAPLLKGAKVAAEVLSHGRHKKIHIVKFKRRKHHDKWQGHRQNFTELKITEISA